MLTLEMLKSMPADTIFATGVLSDSEDCLFMTGSGKELRWVAVRGGIDDWCVYTLFADKSVEEIRRFGDKVHDKRNIQRCVVCDEEAFLRYRYLQIQIVML